jgi:predicted NAD/FAD-dependent oxidoreductase
MKYVIIGAGIAGVMAAKTIRNRDASGEISLSGKKIIFLIIGID